MSLEETPSPVDAPTAESPEGDSESSGTASADDHGEPSPVEESAEDAEVLGTTTRDRVVLGTLVTVALLLAAWQWARLSGWGNEPVEIERQTPLFFEFKLDPNEATWVELMQLEGIGEVLARRIVEDREANGPFASVDDMQRVSGIGAKTVEKMRPWLAIDPVQTESE